MKWWKYLLLQVKYMKDVISVIYVSCRVKLSYVLGGWYWMYVSRYTLYYGNKKFVFSGMNGFLLVYFWIFMTDILLFTEDQVELWAERMEAFYAFPVGSYLKNLLYSWYHKYFKLIFVLWPLKIFYFMSSIYFVFSWIYSYMFHMHNSVSLKTLYIMMYMYYLVFWLLLRFIMNYTITFIILTYFNLKIKYKTGEGMKYYFYAFLFSRYYKMLQIEKAFDELK